MVAKTLVVAALAACGVWLLMVATFRPMVAFDPVYADNRPYCSGGFTIPSTVDGVRVQPTMPPHCRGGPIPAGAVGPSPVPAIGTFLLVGWVGLLVISFGRSEH